MEQLQMKHLVGYLTYNLKLKFVSQHEADKLSIGDIVSLKGVNDGYIHVNGYQTNNKSYLPILKPLIEYKNYPDILDEFSDFSEEQFENDFFVLPGAINAFDFVNYTIMELMFKHHLDIFGLIDKELAIDFNTINKEL